MIFEEIWTDDDEYLKDLEHEDALDYGDFSRIKD